jgi:hypothetical protein
MKSCYQIWISPLTYSKWAITNVPQVAVERAQKSMPLNSFRSQCDWPHCGWCPILEPPPIYWHVEDAPQETVTNIKHSAQAPFLLLWIAYLLLTTWICKGGPFRMWQSQGLDCNCVSRAFLLPMSLWHLSRNTTLNPPTDFNSHLDF